MSENEGFLCCSVYEGKTSLSKMLTNNGHVTSTIKRWQNFDWHQSFMEMRIVQYLLAKGDA